MRVLVLTPYPYGTTAGPRSSFELWERVLTEADISLDYAVFETDPLHEIIYQRGRVVDKAREMSRAYAAFVPRVLRQIRTYDAVLVNREATLVGPALIERAVVRQGIPLIYLLDDPLYIPYRSPSNGWLSYLKFFGKVKTLCRMSTAVLANSPSNTDFARKHNPNVWNIPSVVDADVYSGWMPRDDRTSRHVCVGWTGSSTTVGNLRVIHQPLKAVSARDDAEVLLIGARDFGLPDIPHVGLEWRRETEVEDLRRLDIGLVPLPRTPWTPHKFYLKLVQYMALGIPPVATPLGANPIVIDDGETGFLAEDDISWQRVIERLVEDDELRERVGKNAAQVAHQRYTLQANTDKIIAAFQSALTIPRSADRRGHHSENGAGRSAHTDSPQVTVVIPVWDNYVRFLHDALESLHAQQVAPQILLVDNASAVPIPVPPGAEVVRSSRRLGLGEARNFGLNRVRTPYVVVWDADDLMLPGTLELLAQEIEAAPNLVAFSTANIEDSGKRHRWPRRWVTSLTRIPPLFSLLHCVWSLFPTTGATIMRTNLVRSGGGFSDADSGDDWVAGVSLAFRGRVRWSERPGRLYRRRNGSIWASHSTAGHLIAHARTVRVRVRNDPGIPRWAKVSMPLILVGQYTAIGVHVAMDAARRSRRGDLEP